MRTDGQERPGISIVCVYNDPGVRADCLDRSIAAYAGDLDIDYIPVDNTRQSFVSAGAALNHGARQARFDCVVLVHQDVYFHSIDRLADAAAELQGERWGVLGACGVSGRGEFVGRMRDRVEIVGNHAFRPVEVDSVDEVLFMVRRDRLLEHPLTEDPNLAWHAYAVEYGLRLRALGHLVGAVDLAITHHSLTINLDRLHVAHRKVAALYPDRLPLHTTCATVGARPDDWRRAPILRDHRWRARWLVRSVVAARIRRRIQADIVLSDIRHDVDLLRLSEGAPLHVLNLDRTSTFSSSAGAPVTLLRGGQPVVMHALGTMPELVGLLGSLGDTASVLVTNLTENDLASLRAQVGSTAPWLVGLQSGEPWLLTGTVLDDLPSQWSEARAVPFGKTRATARER